MFQSVTAYTQIFAQPPRKACFNTVIEHRKEKRTLMYVYKMKEYLKLFI
jgi:hypothetical protein